MTALTVSDVRMTPASADDQADGLLGWIKCRIGDSLIVDGIALRKTLAGELRLSFPRRRASDGREYPYLRPDSDSARREFESRIFAALGVEPTTDDTNEGSTP